jgi:hypothetical protein
MTQANTLYTSFGRYLYSFLPRITAWISLSPSFDFDCFFYEYSISSIFNLMGFRSQILNFEMDCHNARPHCLPSKSKKLLLLLFYLALSSDVIGESSAGELPV